MACEIQKIGVVVALGNAVASTPGVAFGAVAPPLEPALALKILAIGFLIKCFEDNDLHEDAESLKREQNRLRQELESLKQRVQ
jgi:hypothetical protein